MDGYRWANQLHGYFNSFHKSYMDIALVFTKGISKELSS